MTDKLSYFTLSVGVDGQSHLAAVQEAFERFAVDMTTAIERHPEAKYGLRTIETEAIPHGVGVSIACTVDGAVHCDMAVVTGPPELDDIGWRLPIVHTIPEEHGCWHPGAEVDIHIGPTEAVRERLKLVGYQCSPKTGPEFAIKPSSEPGDVITRSIEWMDGPSPKALELSKQHTKDKP